MSCHVRVGRLRKEHPCHIGHSGLSTSDVNLGRRDRCIQAKLVSYRRSSCSFGRLQLHLTDIFCDSLHMNINHRPRDKCRRVILAVAQKIVLKLFSNDMIIG